MAPSTGDRDGASVIDVAAVRRWFLLEANRWLLSGTVLVSVFVILVLASGLGLSPLRQIVENHGGFEFLFTAFIGAIITGTSIVVTINQLVLSQELGAVGDQRERMNEAMAFRREVEDITEEAVMPPEPAGFVWELLDGVQNRGERLEAAANTAGSADVRRDIEAYVEELLGETTSVMDDLDDAQFGTFEVTWAAMSFEYSRHIFELRQLHADHRATITDEASAAVDDLVDALTLFGPTREHFKTLYFQWALIQLSRALLYIAIPALTVMALMLMYVDATALPGSTLGVDNLVWLTSTGFVVGIAPFVVFIAFILRIATVAKRTLAMGPFILEASDRETDLD